AGASDAGRQLAAETAEVVFAPAGNLEAGKALFADIKERARAIGRDPESIKILPGALVIVGETVEAAIAKRTHLDNLVHYDSGIASLNSALGYDVSGFDPDGPLPEIPQTNASKSARERVIALAQRENLTIRQLAQHIGSYSGLAFVGTPQTIASDMEQWLTEEGSDGFNVMFPFVPEGLNDFVDKVVPELQRRGIFRKEYEGKTLRENLGLARPANRFFEATTASVS
ncbi:LLM class flavin-dependent oxidoreductase, partial [Scytonema sp. PRP1]|uniref:LLM class flavin-dependent oxidoreductase n=1 Tax=Scytonema sp. PRP1 TaxID=3120513 RepID=UPI00300C1C2C